MATKNKTISNAYSTVNQQEGWEDFGKKKRWFSQSRDTNGKSLGNFMLNANEQVKKMNEHVFEQPAYLNDNPTDNPELITFEKAKGDLKKVANPHPDGATNFVSDSFEVFGTEDLSRAYLRLPVSSAYLANVIPASVRLFRYEKTTNRWNEVRNSGYNPEHGFVWARIHREGIYSAIGLPLNPAKLNTLVTLYNQREAIHEGATAKEKNAHVDAILKGVVLSEHTTNAFGMETGDQLLSPGNFPPGGWAEWDLLDELAPFMTTTNVNQVPISSLALTPFKNIIAVPIVNFGWYQVGPTNVSGRIKSIAIHPTNGNILIAGAANGGVWRTTDGGSNWSSMWFTENSMAVGSCAIATSNPSIMYAATGEDTPGWGPSYPGVGVYKSIDGGTNWADFGNGVIGGRCTKIIIHPTNPNTVYVATDTGLFKTMDGGTNWTSVHSGHASDALMNPTAPDTLYVAIWNDGIYKTTDGAVSWIAANGGYKTARLGNRTVLIDESLPTGSNAGWIKLAMGKNGANGCNFLVAKMGIKSGTIYYTDDGGSGWLKMADNVQPADYNSWTNMIAVHPSNQQIIIAGGIGLSRTSNGSAFTSVTGTHSDHHGFVFDPNNANVCFMTCDGGVYKSINAGLTWTLSSNGIRATQLYSIGVSQAGAFVLGGATQDQGIIMTNGNNAWTDTGAGNEGGHFIVDPNNSQNIYATPWSRDLVRSTTGGTGFSQIVNGLSETLNGNTATLSVSHVAVKPGDSNTLLCCGHLTVSGSAFTRVYRSTNKGNNWTNVLDLPSNPMRLAFAPSNGLICYVVTADGKVFKSANSGVPGSWAEPYTIANMPPANTITCISVGWNDANLIVIGYGGFDGNRIFRSLNGGQTWQNITGSGAGTTFPALPVNGLVFNQFDTDVIYAATDNGVLVTTDGGLHWNSFNTGFPLWNNLPKIIVSQINLYKTSNTLYISTMGRGAFKRPL